MTTTKHRVCVFAGSRDGTRRPYRSAARIVGDAIARKGWGLVYGGAGVGLMGAMADAALAAGGEVIGVIPRSMVDRELLHPGLTQAHVVDSMHERKQTMHALSHAFAVLPGGYGTLDETFEAATWLHLAIHDKPIAMLDVEGFWQPLLAWIERALADGFVEPSQARALRVVGDVGSLLEAVGPKPA